MAVLSNTRADEGGDIPEAVMDGLRTGLMMT